VVTTISAAEDEENFQTGPGSGTEQKRRKRKMRTLGSYGLLPRLQVEHTIKELLDGGTSRSALSDEKQQAVIAIHGIFPSPWASTPAREKRAKGKKPPPDPEMLMRRQLAEAIHKVQKEKIRFMPSPMVLLKSIYGCFANISRESKRKNRHSDVVIIDDSSDDESNCVGEKRGLFVANASYLFKKYRPGGGRFKIRLYKATACRSPSSVDDLFMQLVNKDNVLEWDSPPVDKCGDAPACANAQEPACGYYATICIDGMEFDYSRCSLLDDMLPQQLDLRSSKGRRLYESQSMAKTAAQFLHTFNHHTPDTSITSLLQSKFLRMTEEPLLMRDLINQHGSWTPWPKSIESGKEGVAEYVFVTFGGNFARPGSVEPHRVPLDDPHIGLLRHGSRYYICGFRGGRGLAFENGETISEQGNIVWRNMAALHHHCQVWNVDQPSVGHGTRVYRDRALRRRRPKRRPIAVQ
jgi:hypothetical protein